MQLLRWQARIGRGGDAASWLRLSLALASFGLYAFAIVSQRADRTATFAAERLSFAAALSTVIYHAPLGMYYPDVWLAVLNSDGSPEAAVALLPETTKNFGYPISKAGHDGNGVGYILVSVIGFALFGYHSYMPALMFLSLLGLSSALFLLRFTDGRAIVVPIYYTSLFFILCSYLTWSAQTAFDFPFGGIRYFALLGILPIFHLSLELSDPDAPRLGRRWPFLVLALQTVILVIAILTRTSNATLLGGVVLIGIIALWRLHRRRLGVKLQVWKGATIAATAVGSVSLFLLFLPPHFAQEGRVSGIIWHRIFISLGMNPEFPFGDMAQHYTCDYFGPKIDASLKPGNLDSNGECVWDHYAHDHGLSFQPDNIHIYESVLRQAFFDVAREYPRQVIDTFLFYKYPLVLSSIQQTLDRNTYEFRSLPGMVRWLFAAELGALFLVLLLSALQYRTMYSLQILAAGALAALSLMPGYFAAWAGPVQSVDLRVLVVFMIGAAVCVAVEWLRRGWRRARNFIQKGYAEL